MSEFNFKTGQEILDSKEELQKKLYEQEYASFCEKMNKFWKENDVESQLIYNDIAEIKVKEPRVHDSRSITPFTLTYSENAERYAGNHIENCKNIIGHEFPFYSINKAEALLDFFHINNFVMFYDFMEEHGFEWHLSLEVNDAIPAQLFDKLFYRRRWFITEYSIILRIECKQVKQLWRAPTDLLDAELMVIKEFQKWKMNRKF